MQPLLDATFTYCLANSNHGQHFHTTITIVLQQSRTYFPLSSIFIQDEHLSTVECSIFSTIVIKTIIENNYNEYWAPGIRSTIKQYQRSINSYQPFTSHYAIYHHITTVLPSMIMPLLTIINHD